MYCDSGYDVTIAAYSLTELYLPKMENVRLFVAPESKIMDFPVLILCNVHIRTPSLNEQQEQIMFRSDIQRATMCYCFVTLRDFRSGSLYCNLSRFLL